MDFEHKLLAIAQFHARLLAIHPFADGNGRLARQLLVQQSLDLLGAIDPSLLDRGAAYREALRGAIDDDDTDALADLIRRAVVGA